MTGASAPARGIGVVSVAIAAAAFIAPAPLARLLGYGERRWLIRAFGARDLVLGAGLLAADDVRPWLRARLAAEVADTLLHAAGAATGAFGRRRAAAIALGAAGFGLLDYYALRRASSGRAG